MNTCQPVNLLGFIDAPICWCSRSKSHLVIKVKEENSNVKTQKNFVWMLMFGDVFVWSTEASHSRPQAADVVAAAEPGVTTQAGQQAAERKT